MTENLNWDLPFLMDFALNGGLSQKAKSTKRTLSQMSEMYQDQEAAAEILKDGDPLVYEFYELGAPEQPQELAFGTSITYPGKVGQEYYMTKGHFHVILDTAEVYYTLQGHGMMMMENPEGDVQYVEMKPGQALYVPKRYAHRTINLGDTPFVSFFCFRGDAGHDYGTIETKGYRKYVVEGADGKPEIKDNPRWK